MLRSTLNGDNIDARGDMLLASAMAGIAFNATHLGLVHAFALPLGNKSGIARGLVNATMLPPVMAYNASLNGEGDAKVAAPIGEATADRAAHAVLELRGGVTQTLAYFGVT